MAQEKKGRRLTPEEIAILTGVDVTTGRVIGLEEEEEPQGEARPMRGFVPRAAATATRLAGAVGSGVVGAVPTPVTTPLAAIIAGGTEAAAQKMESPAPIDKSRVAVEAGLGAIPLSKIYKFGKPLIANMLRGATMGEASHLLRRYNDTGEMLPQTPGEAAWDLASMGLGAAGGLFTRKATAGRLEKPVEEAIDEADPALARLGELIDTQKTAAPRVVRPSGPRDVDMTQPQNTAAALRVLRERAEREAMLPQPIIPARGTVVTPPLPNARTIETGVRPAGVEAKQAVIARRPSAIQTDRVSAEGLLQDPSDIKKAIDESVKRATDMGEAQRKASEVVRKQEQQIVRREQAADVQDLRARRGGTDVGKVKQAEEKAAEVARKELVEKEKAATAAAKLVEDEARVAAAQRQIDDALAAGNLKEGPLVVTETTAKVPTVSGAQTAKKSFIEKVAEESDEAAESGGKRTPAPKIPPVPKMPKDPKLLANMAFGTEIEAQRALGASGKKGTVVGDVPGRKKWRIIFEGEEAGPAVKPTGVASMPLEGTIDNPVVPKAAQGAAEAAPTFSSVAHKTRAEAVKAATKLGLSANNVVKDPSGVFFVMPEVAEAPAKTVSQAFPTWIKARQHAKQNGGEVVKRGGKFYVEGGKPPTEPPTPPPAAPAPVVPKKPKGGPSAGGARVKPPAAPKGPKAEAVATVKAETPDLSKPGQSITVPAANISQADKQLAARAGVKNASEVQPHRQGLSKQYVETGKGPVGKAEAAAAQTPPGLTKVEGERMAQLQRSAQSKRGRLSRAEEMELAALAKKVEAAQAPKAVTPASELKPNLVKKPVEAKPAAQPEAPKAAPKAETPAPSAPAKPFNPPKVVPAKAPKAKAPKAEAPKEIVAYESIPDNSIPTVKGTLEGLGHTNVRAESLGNGYSKIHSTPPATKAAVPAEPAKGVVRVDLTGAKDAAEVQRRVVGELEKYAAKVKAADEAAGVTEKGERVVEDVAPMTLEIPNGPTITVNKDQVNNLIERFSKGLPQASAKEATTKHTLPGMRGGSEAWQGIVGKAPRRTTGIPKETTWGTGEKPTMAKAGEEGSFGTDIDIIQHDKVVGPTAAKGEFVPNAATTFRKVDPENIPKDATFGIYAKTGDDQVTLLVSSDETALNKVFAEWKRQRLRPKQGTIKPEEIAGSLPKLAEDMGSKVTVGVVGEKTPLAPIVQKTAGKAPEAPTAPTKGLGAGVARKPATEAPEAVNKASGESLEAGAQKAIAKEALPGKYQLQYQDPKTGALVTDPKLYNTHEEAFALGMNTNKNAFWVKKLVGSEATPEAPKGPLGPSGEGSTGSPAKVKGGAPSKASEPIRFKDGTEVPKRPIEEAITEARAADKAYGEIKDKFAAGQATKEELRAAGEALGKAKAEVAAKASAMLEANPKAEQEVKKALDSLRNVTRRPDPSDELANLPADEAMSRLSKIVEAFKKANPKKKNFGDVGGYTAAEVLMAMGLGSVGALAGAKANPEDPYTGAALGALAGGSLPFAPAVFRSLIDHVNTNPHLTPAARARSTKTIGMRMKETFKDFSIQMMPDAYRASLLTSLSLPINAWVGPYGAALMGSIEHVLGGDPRGLKALRLMTPARFARYYKEAATEAKALIGSAKERHEGVFGKEGPEWFRTVTEKPADMLTQGDVAARRILQEAGFSEAEARAITLTSEPVSTAGKAIGNLRKTRSEATGKPSLFWNMLIPFYRTNVNQVEQGALRTPAGNYLRKEWGMMPISKRMFLAQNFVTGSSMGIGFALGYALPSDDNYFNKMMLKTINNFGGQYGTAMSLAYVAGQATQKGKDPVMAVMQSAVQRDLPVPSNDIFTDVMSFYKKARDGEDLDIGDVPLGLVVPAGLKDLQYWSEQTGLPLEPVIGEYSRSSQSKLTPGQRALRKRKELLKKYKREALK